MSEVLKLTAYLGERERSDGRLLADVLMDLYEHHGVRTSALLRRIEGFGINHRLQTERLLTLSEDLPIVALAVDEAPRIEALVEDAREVVCHSLLTLERERRLQGPAIPADLAADDRIQLTVYLGRGERVGSQPAYLTAVRCLQQAGLDGASVLLGLDGAAHGVRRRGRFLARNAQVPLMILSVGDPPSVARAIPELLEMLHEPEITLAPVRVCRRDGIAFAGPRTPSLRQPAGAAGWQKLAVYAGEQTLHGGEPIHAQLVRRLRREGAAGATTVRGLWGYHGDHPPHGERLWSLRRHVPALTLVLDTHENMRRWSELVTELTGESGLVTSEEIGVLQVGGGAIEYGGQDLR